MIFRKTRLYIAHTDDVLVFVRSVRATEEDVTQLREATLSFGLVINRNKVHKNKQFYKNVLLELVIDGQVFEWGLSLTC
jgi:hypothetical protein